MTIYNHKNEMRLFVKKRNATKKNALTDIPSEIYLRLRFCVRRSIRGKVPSLNARTL